MLYESALVCPRTGAFIFIWACRSDEKYKGVPCRGTRVRIQACGGKPYTWSASDVARCQRNERFFLLWEDALMFARAIATTLRTAMSLTPLEFHEGEAFDKWRATRPNYWRP